MHACKHVCIYDNYVYACASGLTFSHKLNNLSTHTINLYYARALYVIHTLGNLLVLQSFLVSTGEVLLLHCNLCSPLQLQTGRAAVHHYPVYQAYGLWTLHGFSRICLAPGCMQLLKWYSNWYSHCGVGTSLEVQRFPGQRKRFFSQHRSGIIEPLSNQPGARV